MRLHDLHHLDQPLLLPNAWDVPSALAFAAAGFAAVGTTSFGLALCTGRPDGERASRDATADLVRRLRPLGVHVSADVEDGYADAPAEVAAYVAGLAEDGAAGINLEDSSAGRLVEAELHAAKVRAVKERCPDLFLNARVDTYWLGERAGLDETLRRATAYLGAGADGVFVPGVTDPDLIRTLAGEIAAPLNVLAVPGVRLAELGALGVRRVSTGSLPYRAAAHAALEVARVVRDGGTLPEARPYAELQHEVAAFAGAHADASSDQSAG